MKSMSAEDYLSAFQRDPATYAIVSFPVAAELLGVSRQSISRAVLNEEMFGVAIETQDGKHSKGVSLQAVQKKLEREYVLEKILVDHAQNSRSHKRKPLLEYSKDLMERLDMDHRLSNDRKKLGLMLAHISWRSVREHGYMLSALAVSKQSRRPNQEGFYGCEAAHKALDIAIEAGRLSGNAANFFDRPKRREAFFCDQIQQIEAAFRTKFDL